MTTSVRLNHAALDELVREHGVVEGVLKVGEQVAEEAAARAPKRTGEGAKSIHAEVDEETGEVRVSWDEEHDYMFFHEVGTSEMSATPFLRPALDAHYTL